MTILCLQRAEQRRKEWLGISGRQVCATIREFYGYPEISLL